MTKSTGERGEILSALPPIFTMAVRMAAKSTTAGTPVKSCIRTLVGLNAISCWDVLLWSQSAIALMSLVVTVLPSSKRNKFSRSTFKE
ncbi:Uncharacterised protein [Legionella pneumophila]|nr:Uncharacterised protein [Legionella pneumophila]